MKYIGLPRPSYPLAARKERTVLQRLVSRSVTSKDCRWLSREDFNRLLIFITNISCS